MENCFAWGIEAWRAVGVGTFLGFALGSFVMGGLVRRVWKKRYDEEVDRSLGLNRRRTTLMTTNIP